MEFGYIEKYKLGCEKVENGLYKEMVIKAKEIQTELRGWFSCVKLCFDDLNEYQFCKFDGREKTILRPKDFNKLETLIQWVLNTKGDLQPPVFDESEG